jgi:hypothetical protein
MVVGRRAWGAVLTGAIGGACLACLVCPTASADEPGASGTRAPAAPDDATKIEACRPTITCTAELMAPGLFELETGGNLSHGNGKAFWSLPVLFKQGLLRWLELEVGSNGLTVFRDTGGYTYFDDIVFGPKIRFVEQRGLLPTISTSVEVSAPTFSAEGYERNWDLFFAAYATKDIGTVRVDVNAWLNMWRLGEGGGTPQGLFSTAVTKSLPANFAAEIGAFYQTGADPSDPRDAGLQGAFTYSPVSWLIVDAGADWGFFPSERKYSIFGGVALVPAVLWRPHRR